MGSPMGMRLVNQRRAPVPPLPVETTDADRIAALESERLLLKPYDSTKGLTLLKRRVREIESALSRLRGLPLE